MRPSRSDTAEIRQIIEKAREEKISRHNLLKHLEEQTEVETDDLISSLAEIYGYTVTNYAEMCSMESEFSLITYSDARAKNCVLLRAPDQQLIFVFSDVFDALLFDWAAHKIDYPFTTNLAHQSDIKAYLASQEESMRTVDRAISGVDVFNQNEISIEELSLTSIESDHSQVVKLVRSTLYDALKADASDIHIETLPIGLAIKYRLDGVLAQMGLIKERQIAEQIVSRIKVMSELDITETRVPQDGRFRAFFQGREIDFRVSVMPSVHGEDVVIRVLDKKSLTDAEQQLRLDTLGFSPEVIDTLRKYFRNPYGMILVTGPTGSGKTTTLYAAISETNDGLHKIITIEDPVEYELPGVLQIPINEKKGLTFARGLRSILRHDPDRIMVGEIRDTETAQIAIQSALTGHLVFTTVHANNVFDVLGRFLNMDVDPYSFVSALNVVIAQRLIRTVCKYCVAPLKIEDAVLRQNKITAPDTAKFVHSAGCGHCRGTGYRGRRAIAEVLCLDDTLRELIAEKSSIKQIKEYAASHGTLLLREAALQLAYNGETTLDEVNRVTAMD